MDSGRNEGQSSSRVGRTSKVNTKTGNERGGHSLRRTERWAEEHQKGLGEKGLQGGVREHNEGGCCPSPLLPCLSFFWALPCLLEERKCYSCWDAWGTCSQPHPLPPPNMSRSSLLLPPTPQRLTLDFSSPWRKKQRDWPGPGTSSGEGGQGMGWRDESEWEQFCSQLRKDESPSKRPQPFPEGQGWDTAQDEVISAHAHNLKGHRQTQFLQGTSESWQWTVPLGWR